MIARRGLPAGSLPVRRKRDERRDRTAVFPRIRFHRTDRKLVCRTGAGTLLSKSWAADSREGTKKAGSRASGREGLSAFGCLFRKHFLHVARMQFLVYSVAFDIYRIEVVQFEYDT